MDIVAAVVAAVAAAAAEHSLFQDDQEAVHCTVLKLDTHWGLGSWHLVTCPHEKERHDQLRQVLQLGHMGI